MALLFFKKKIRQYFHFLFHPTRDELIFKELLQRSKSSVFGQFVCVSLVFIDWNQSSLSHLGIQLTLLAITLGLFIRLGLAFEFVRFSPASGRALFTLITFYLSFFWGFTLFLIFESPRELSSLHSLATLLASALIASAVYSFSCSKRDFIIYTTLLMSFVSIHFWNVWLTEGILSSLLMGFAFYGFILSQGIHQNKRWIKTNQENQRLQSILDSFPGTISLIREDKYVSISKGIQNLFKRSPEDYIGKPVGSIEGNYEFNKLYQEFSESSEKRHQFETILQTEYGPKNLFFIFEKLKRQGEKVIISLDITQLKITEQELSHHKAQLASSSKLVALGQMAAGLAHEINNPLAVIVARVHRISQILKTEKSPIHPSIEQSLDAINKTVNRISQIVKGLKTFSHDGQSGEKQTVLLDHIIMETLSYCESRFKNHQVDFQYINENKSIEINCNPTQISQVFLNLLNNAFDALSGTAEKKISFKVVQLNKIIRIQIQDNGPGIPSQHQDKLMTPFFTTKEIGKGTGLGLSISKGIIEAHQGKFYFLHHEPMTTVCIELAIDESKKIQSAA